MLTLLLLLPKDIRHIIDKIVHREKTLNLIKEFEKIACQHWCDAQTCFAFPYMAMYRSWEWVGYLQKFVWCCKKGGVESEHIHRFDRKPYIPYPMLPKNY